MKRELRSITEHNSVYFLLMDVLVLSNDTKEVLNSTHLLGFCLYNDRIVEKDRRLGEKWVTDSNLGRHEKYYFSFFIVYPLLVCVLSYPNSKRVRCCHLPSLFLFLVCRYLCPTT